MSTTPHFCDAYAEYRWLRKQHGWYAEGGMIRSVWEKCEPEAQEGMLEQLRAPLRKRDQYVATHGEVW